MDESSQPKLKSLFVVTKLLSKLYGIKKTEEKGIVDVLTTMKYFQKLIHDPVQRYEFLEAASDYLKFKFLPKGTILFRHGTCVSNLSIVVEGKAIVYCPKSEDELAMNSYDLRKRQVIEYYIEYINHQKSMDKAKQNESLGIKSSKKKGKSKLISISKIKEMAISTAKSQPLTGGSFSDIVEVILKPNNSLLPDFLGDFDLTTEEKLLLLSHYDQIEDVIQNEQFSFKNESCLSAGDAFGEASLLKLATFNRTAVALEDLYLASFVKEDFESLYATPRLSNVKEKMKFLEKMFPILLKDARTKLVYYLEERVLFSRDVIYKEGTESDAIYMIKSGEVDFTTYEKYQKTKEGSSLKHSDKQGNNRVTISILQAGTVFGEEEVVNQGLRQSTAKARQPNTFLYVLRKEIYHEIFSKHYPHIADVFKNWIEVKKTWRKGCFQKEIKEEKEKSLAPDKKEKKFKRKLPPKLYLDNDPIEEPITERIKNKQNMIKIQASIGFKSPFKVPTDSDLQSCISPQYQERRLFNLNFRSLHPSTVSSPVTQRVKTVNQSNIIIESPGIPSNKIKFPLSPREEVENKKSSLYLFNQRNTSKSKNTSPRNKEPKTLSLPRNSSPTQIKETFPRIPNFEIVNDLKKSLRETLRGSKTLRASEPPSSIKVVKTLLESPKINRSPFLFTGNSFSKIGDPVEMGSFTHMPTFHIGQDSKKLKSNVKSGVVAHHRRILTVCSTNSRITSETSSPTLGTPKSGISIKNKQQLLVKTRPSFFNSEEFVLQSKRLSVNYMQ